MTHSRPRVRRRLLLVAIAAGTVIGGGGAAAQSVTPITSFPPVSGSLLEDELAAATMRIAQLEQRSGRVDDLLSALDTMYDGMEAERQLMIELRKPIPDERPSAEAYLSRLQRLSVLADPVRLGQPAARLLETAPAFLDWRDGDYASQEERDAAFLESGAAGFTQDFDDLQKAIMLTVANRLDALLTLRDRIR